MSTPRPATRTPSNRPNVIRLPGPCAQWDEHDADFIREVLDMIGDKWSVLIIGALANGPARYTTLANAIPGISARMLTLTLKHLNRSGLIDRTVFAEVPPKVEYTLTPLGASLLTTVLELANWSARHHTAIRTHQANFDHQAETAGAVVG